MALEYLKRAKPLQGSECSRWMPFDISSQLELSKAKIDRMTPNYL